MAINVLPNIPLDLLLIWIGLIVLPWLFVKKSQAAYAGIILIIGILLTLQVIHLPPHLHWFFTAFVLLLLVGLWLISRESASGSISFNSPQLQPVILLFLAGTSFILIAIRNAWVCDDAYITFRTVDNFVHGLGLTWNPDERVQTYTHPLWLFMVSFARLITGKVYYSSIFISVLFTLTAVILMASKIARNYFTAIAAILLLSFSKAFIDFSTSGLENPLTYLCLVAFFALYWRQTWNSKTFFWLCMIAGLGTLNRMDSVLFFIPSLATVAWHMRHQMRWRLLGIAFAGFSPFILWELFSLGYYGFFFSNTAYAKLNTGIAGSQSVASGFYYIFNSLRMDPITWLIILAGITAPFLKKEKNVIPAAIGIILYILYVIRIGGDFMSGRFFAAPVLCAITLLAHILPLSLSANVFVTAVILFFGVLSPYNPWASGADYRKIGLDSPEGWKDYTWKVLIDEHGIADERAYYYQVTGLLKVPKEDDFNLTSSHPLKDLIKQGKDLAQANQRRILVGDCVGIEGYYAGPKIHFLDSMALGDPLLARLPAKPNCRIGHYEREIPAGYIETIVTGENQIKDPAIAELYSKLTNVIRGPVGRWSRFSDIMQLNFGYTFKAQNTPASSLGPAADERVFVEVQGTDTYAQLMSQGLQATHRNDLDQAFQFWQSALKTDPRRPEAYGNLGILYEIKGDRQMALKFYTRAAEKAPTPWSGYAQRVKNSLLKINKELKYN